MVVKTRTHTIEINKVAATVMPLVVDLSKRQQKLNKQHIPVKMNLCRCVSQPHCFHVYV